MHRRIRKMHHRIRKKTCFKLLLGLLITTLTLAQQNSFKKGDVLNVTIHTSNEATILEVKNGKYKVRYEDVDRENGWVEADKVSPIDKGNTASSLLLNNSIILQQ